MQTYFLDKNTLKIKDILPTTKYQINMDEETNATSTLSFPRKPNADEGDFIKVGDGEVIFQGIIKDIQGQKQSNQTQVNCIDISNIFDRKIYESNMAEMQVGLEDFIYDTIISFFKNGNGDSLLAMNYLTVSQTTSTQIIEPTNAEDGVYNFHTFITNCRQNKDIGLTYILNQGELVVIVANIGSQATIKIDTTLADVTNYNKVYEMDYTAKVTAIAGDTELIQNYYLRNDGTTTTNQLDPLRVTGKTDTIYVGKEEEMQEQAINIFKGNRYNHLIEFDIRKDSKLVDTSLLTIGRQIQIKTNDGILYSYISSLSFDDSTNFIKYKSGKIRTRLTEKIKQKEYTTGMNKLDKSGGIITGDLTVMGTLVGSPRVFIQSTEPTNANIGDWWVN